jgi:polyisoprenoid-binding protein YceI
MKISTRILFAGAAMGCVIATGVVAQDAMTKNPAEVRAGAYTLDASHGKITWAVTHIGFSTYIGQFTGTAAKLKLDPKNPSAATLEASVDMNSVGALNEGLDKHLKGPDFFDVAKFPMATFKSTSVKTTGERTADITGDLTLHGVTKPITIQATFNQAGPFPMSKAYTVGFDGVATIKRSEFGINYGVPMVSDDVKLKFEAEFKADAAAK